MTFTVLLAAPRGFCAGVERAIRTVELALDARAPDDTRPVFVRHEIVHNRVVVEDLRARGAVFVEETSQIPLGATAVFSAHGVAPTVRDEAAARDLVSLDATCPLVSRVHAAVLRYAGRGYTILFVGHAGHPEVEGTIGQIGAQVHLVSTVADVAALDMPADLPLAYVTQTTLSVDDTRAIIEALNARFTDIDGPDTADICYATQHRQSAVRDLARMVEVILVVGATNSSNSNRLREIGLEEGVPSYLIADASALDPAWVAEKETIGLTAGASAPESLIIEVIEALRRIGPVVVTPMNGVEEHIQFRLPAELRA
jgi:4-hydroxy-3-methylbut-2-enyl diphosphate reductase